MSDGVGTCAAREFFYFTGFADVPVLTELASKIAASRTKGKYCCSRVEVVERFFLDRINTKAGGESVRREYDLTASRLPNKTEGLLSITQSAVSRAYVTADASVVEYRVEFAPDRIGFELCSMAHPRIIRPVIHRVDSEALPAAAIAGPEGERRDARLTHDAKTIRSGQADFPVRIPVVETDTTSVLEI